MKWDVQGMAKAGLLKGVKVKVASVVQLEAMCIQKAPLWEERGEDGNPPCAYFLRHPTKWEQIQSSHLG